MSYAGIIFLQCSQKGANTSSNTSLSVAATRCSTVRPTNFSTEAFTVVEAFDPIGTAGTTGTGSDLSTFGTVPDITPSRFGLESW